MRWKYQNTNDTYKASKINRGRLGWVLTPYNGPSLQWKKKARYKQFLVYRTFTDEEIMSESFVDLLVEGYVGMRPLFDYMSEVLTTDGNGLPLYWYLESENSYRKKKFQQTEILKQLHITMISAAF